MATPAAAAVLDARMTLRSAGACSVTSRRVPALPQHHHGGGAGRRPDHVIVDHDATTSTRRCELGWREIRVGSSTPPTSASWDERGRRLLLAPDPKQADAGQLPRSRRPSSRDRPLHRRARRLAKGLRLDQAHYRHPQYRQWQVYAIRSN